MHTFTSAFDLNVRRTIISYFKALTTIKSSGITDIPHQPPSVLFAAAKDGNVLIYTIFGGQGTSEVYFDELQNLYNLYTPYIAPFIQTITDELFVPLIRASSSSYNHGLDVSSWLSGYAARPPVSYLASVAIPFPIIGPTQLTQHLVAFKVSGLTPGKMFERFFGATSHSQGIISASSTYERFAPDSKKAVARGRPERGFICQYGTYWEELHVNIKHIGMRQGHMVVKVETYNDRDVKILEDAHPFVVYGFPIIEIVKDNPKERTIHFDGIMGQAIHTVWTQRYTFSHSNGLLFTTQFAQIALVTERATSEDMQLKGFLQNNAGQQSVCAGELATLQMMTNVLNYLKIQKVGLAKRGFAIIPPPGISVLFHSHYLWTGVMLFGAHLGKKTNPLHLNPDMLVGRYILNLIVKQLEVTKEYTQVIYNQTSSLRPEKVLCEWDEEGRGPAEQCKQLAYVILVELLAYQFASLVRWSETQGLLFTAHNFKCPAETGPSPTLTGMATRTLKAKYEAGDNSVSRTCAIRSSFSDLFWTGNFTLRISQHPRKLVEV
ncbi:hypothetical protein BDM02DRAFT_3131492 [Thelephora ganbajun]|uniref:Uncharacterized protein n=1 Tax=Thelephora ganbajun TaxID=370292 RepID=A0ACB6Z6V1_THEGA|nr:hypothetical protein BDM02DRAFT_3131492 [Thelephora ganbajun]